MSKEHAKQSVALSSVLASAVLTIMKGAVGIMTGSMGVLSEAAHSALDFGAALLTLFAVREGDKPADDKHPYGHAKIESVSALIETGLLFVTSGWIIYEASQRLINHTAEVDAAWYAFVVIGLSIVIDYSRSRALTRVANATKSQALEADALHFSSDMLSSAVVLVGLGFVALGFPLADPLAAIGVSIFVAHAGYKLGKRTIDVLVDTTPEGVMETILHEAKKVDGIVSIDRARARPAGPVLFVDISISVSRKLSQEKVQSICRGIEQRVQKAVPDSDVTVHTRPVSMNNETIVEQVQIMASNHGVVVHDIAIHLLDKKKYVSFDIEVDSKLSMAKAHKAASHLEAALKESMGEDLEINSHIEPLTAAILEGKMVSQDVEARVKKVIDGVAKNVEGVREVHNLRIRHVKDKLFISLHCLFDDEAVLEDVHDSCSRFEHLVRERLPEVKRVVVHPEPVSGN